MVAEADKVMEMLKEFDNVMLVTHGQGQKLDARPMHIARVDQNCDIWFLTRDDGKVDELKNLPQAQVVAQKEKDSWLSISGRVNVIEDKNRIRELWKEPYKAWFPQGVDDPSIRLLAFHSEHGEYWDQRGTNKLEFALKVAKSYVTGDTPKPDKAMHGETVL